MPRPFVSFLIPTYGRAATQPAVLAEGIWWCCNQDYSDFEVIILNDAPNQTICCPHPKVEIINAAKRYPCVGAKLNAGLEICKGEIVMISDDDDISLPHRASQAVAMLEGFDFWQPMLWWYRTPSTKVSPDENGYCFTQGAFRRDIFRGKVALQAGGYDGVTAAWAHRTVRCNPQKLTRKTDISYIYRWGFSDNHMSSYKDIMQSYRDRKPGPAGCYDIVPTMKADWMAEINQVVASG